MSNPNDQDDFWKMVTEKSEKQTKYESQFQNGDPSDFAKIVDHHDSKKLVQQKEYAEKMRKIFLESGMSHKRRRNVGTIDNPKGLTSIHIGVVYMRNFFKI